jgi:glucose-1-phosphate adenylyltransferase
MSRFLPPSKVRDSLIENSILGDGCVVKPGSEIKHSVIGLRSLIGQNCRIHDTLYMGADYYETEEECLLIRGCLPMGLGTLPRPRRAPEPLSPVVFVPLF